MSQQLIANNKKATFDYFILDTYEAGISLLGPEVKSIRAGQINLKDSFAIFKNNDLFLVGVHISNYFNATIFNRDSYRERQLLLHKNELRKLKAAVAEKSFSLVPLNCYINEKGKVKITLALVKGKKLFDKRETLAKKAQALQAARDLLA